MTLWTARAATNRGFTTALAASTFGAAMFASALTGGVGLAHAAPDPLPVPPFGSVGTQVINNQINSVLALAPIVLGSTEQCTVCIGPTAIDPSGFVSGYTGWGLIGIANGAIGAPGAFVSELISGGSIGEAIGNALASLQYPIANTFTLLAAPRNLGGLDIATALTRAQTVLSDLVVGVGDVLTQALITGPLNLVFSVAAATTIFVNAISKGETLITAINAGRGPIQKGIDENQEAFTLKLNNLRRALFNDTNTAPAIAVNPIPVVPAPPTASVAEVAEQSPAAGVSVAMSTPVAVAGEDVSPTPSVVARGEAEKERKASSSAGNRAEATGGDPAPSAAKGGSEKRSKAPHRSSRRGSAAQD